MSEMTNDEEFGIYENEFEFRVYERIDGYTNESPKMKFFKMFKMTNAQEFGIYERISAAIRRIPLNFHQNFR